MTDRPGGAAENAACRAPWSRGIIAWRARARRPRRRAGGPGGTWRPSCPDPCPPRPGRRRAARRPRPAAPAPGRRDAGPAPGRSCSAPRSRLASWSAITSLPRLVQTCGSTPSPWIRPAAGRQHAAPGDEQLAAVGQLADRLHQALAQRRAADHHGAALSGQRAGHDLGGAGRAAVDQHDHGLAGGHVVPVRRHSCAACGLRPAVVAMRPDRAAGRSRPPPGAAARRGCRAGR